MKNWDIKTGQLAMIYCLMAITACHNSNPTQSIQVKKGQELEALLAGNERFLENHPLHPDQTLARLRELKKGQHPFAAIISCADSRVPPELVFDQGLGDLFVIRNAGNIIGDYELGSIEYAVEHLKTPLIIVLGHKKCGAIGAFIEHKHDSIPNHIQSIVSYIKSEPEELALEANVADYYDQAIRANILHGVHVLKQSEPVLKELVAKRKVTVHGALYDLETGKVEILKE